MSLPRDDTNLDADVSFREALTQLSQQERLVCVWLQLGFTHRAVASCCGLSLDEIETMHRDALDKIRRLRGRR